MAVRTPRIFKPREVLIESTERSLISPVEMRKPINRALYWLLLGVLLLMTLSTIFPLYWLFTGALKSPQEFFRVPPTLVPNHLDWQNYASAWSKVNFVRYFANTIGIAAGSWLMQMAVTCTAAFALSKLRPAFGNVIMVMFFSTMMVPGATLLIPRYLTVAHTPLLGINLLNTWWAIWLPGATNAFGIFLLKTFFDQIPMDLTDAARIDGANSWQLFTRIVLPLSKAAIAVLTIGVLMTSWQDFFWPFLVLQNNQQGWPIMVRLLHFSVGAPGLASETQSLSVVIAANALAIIPPVIFFLIFQKYIIRGINLTGLQG